MKNLLIIVTIVVLSLMVYTLSYKEGAIDQIKRFHTMCTTNVSIKFSYDETLGDDATYVCMRIEPEDLPDYSPRPRQKDPKDADDILI